eukprot:5928355-Prymnesium_polylepis.1
MELSIASAQAAHAVALVASLHRFGHAVHAQPSAQVDHGRGIDATQPRHEIGEGDLTHGARRGALCHMATATQVRPRRRRVCAWRRQHERGRERRRRDVAKERLPRQDLGNTPRFRGKFGNTGKGAQNKLICAVGAVEYGWRHAWYCSHTGGWSRWPCLPERQNLLSNTLPRKWPPKSTQRRGPRAAASAAVRFGDGEM